MYDFNIAKLIKDIKTIDPKTILLQFPDGLKLYSGRLARLLEVETGCQIVVSADPCYGACDLALDSMKILNADLLIHFGHTPITPGDNLSKILYVESSSRLSIEESMEKAIKLIKGLKIIGLAATVQHINHLSFAKKILKKEGFRAIIGRSNGKVKYDGQVLGCDFNTVKKISDCVDAFLVITGGDFHGIGVQLVTGKRTIIVDPYLSQAREMTKKVKRVMMIKKAVLGKFLQSNNIAIVIGLKSGQNRFKDALELKRLLEKKGKECTLLCTKEITPDNLNSFPDYDIIVNTACPRIGIDDLNNFFKPLVNLDDVLDILKTNGSSNEKSY